MMDLIKPIEILRNYLVENFKVDIQVLNFTAVMRNYKAKLLNENLYVDLATLEGIFDKLKSIVSFEPFIKYVCRNMTDVQTNKLLKVVGKTNPLNIAEVAYNTDKCFCLNLKFYRPIVTDINKKTTVKLLKKGKINFDGGNSELEMLELYHWLEYLYYTYKDKILVDISKIQNKYDLIKMSNVQIVDSMYTDSFELDNLDDLDDLDELDELDNLDELS
jgi:hypothetical protein